MPEETIKDVKKRDQEQELTQEAKAAKLGAVEIVVPVADVAVSPVAEGRSGNQRGGRRGGDQRRGGGRRGGRQEEQNDGFEQKIVDLARVTRVMAGGKRMRFRACVVIGDRQGTVGMGLAKGRDVTAAINKAVNQAKKDLIKISFVNETIRHEVTEKFKAVKILLKPAPKGKGVVAGGALRMVLELAGVPNVVAKTLGGNNKVTAAKAAFVALRQLALTDAAHPAKAKKEKSADKIEEKNSKPAKKTSK